MISYRTKTLLLPWMALTATLLIQLTRSAEPPHLIPFQGHLARPATADPTKFEPVPSGRYDVLFTLYAAPVGGESKVWGPERHAQVTVVNGLVNALPGSVVGFENTLATQPNFFRRPLYVGITIDTDGSVPGAKIEPASITSQHLVDGTVDAIDLKNDSVRTHHILDGTIGTADLADGSITPAKVQPNTILTGPHYFKVAQYQPLWNNFGGTRTNDLVDFVPLQARGAILKVIVNGSPTASVSGSAVFADEDGAFSTAIHYYHNGVTSYSTWTGGTVFVPFRDGKKIKMRTISNTSNPNHDVNVKSFGSLIGWF